MDDDFAHVRRLVAAIHCQKNVSRPPSPESAASEARATTPGSSASDLSSSRPSLEPQAPWFESNSIATASLMPPSRRDRRASFLSIALPAPEAGQTRSASLTAAPHFNVPKFTVTAPAGEQRRNSYCSFLHVGPFALRRHSNTSLHRSESMVSLSCFRQLSSLVSDDNAAGLQAFLQANNTANVDDRDENGTTALMVACEGGRGACARALLGAGADPGAADHDGWTPLAVCARAGLARLARELLDAGAPVDPRDMGGWTPLMWASYKGHEELVSLLLERGADVHAHGNYNINSLVWAAGRRHSGVVRLLLAAGARANSCDKYATTALTWAARAGDAAAAAALLHAGADPNTAGMYCWTPLLQATQGNHYEIVQMLLEHRPNVNALDKDGYTALAIACKEGYYETAVALINAGAYINVQDHSKDTCLIHAVKGGHKAIVEALLKKFVDLDLPGKDRKTAVYTAVEKGHVAVLKQLLNANPDLELTTVTGDTPLLRAVRSRNAEMVQLLLDKKARVSAADHRGDTALHIAMRARSKQIVEILLRNPKNSQLLYKPNKSNETPYNIDMNYPKTILGQIFGARKLNTNEDNESMLGYELYSAALADMLSEPSLTVPITVGLFARWGSGKSFLLTKLKEEMKNFARQWSESGWTWSWAVAWAAWHAALLGGALVAAAGVAPHVALGVAAALLLLIYLALYTLWYVSNRWEWYWPYAAVSELARRLHSLQLLLQVVFCHPPGPNSSKSVCAQPIRFHFTEQPKSWTQEGEASVVHMMASLHESLEAQYGRLCTRLFRAFRPKPVTSNSDWKWRRACCLPQVVAFELSAACALLGLVLLVLYLTESETQSQRYKVLEYLLMGVASVLAVGALANVYTWGRVISALLLSPRAHLARALRKHADGLLHALRPEMLLLTEMVACLDAFTGQRTRLVVVVDALDSCEQERVLVVLNAVHALCCDARSPFILVLAIDPHIISKAVEASSRRAFSESNIGGWDYLRNLVQLPVYLQNSSLRRVKIAQQTAQRRFQPAEDFSTSLQRSVSARRLSATSELMSSQERIRPAKECSNSAAAARAKRLRPSESVASSVASGLHRIGSGVPGGAADLGRVLLTDDYFSDVNPRSMRRLMNVLYITGRLLKAFQIEFNWYQLASWVNLTEQWPFRTSWIIYHHETYEDHIDDSTSLKHIYDKIKPGIPLARDAEPLMELDRDERKLEVFLGFHRSTLLAADLKIFLPFTINLDPYIKKVIKEEQQRQLGLEEDAGAVLYPPRHHAHAKLLQRKPSKPTSLPPVAAVTAPAPPLFVNWGTPAPPLAAPGQCVSAASFAGAAPPFVVPGLQSTGSSHAALNLINNTFPHLQNVHALRLSRMSAREAAALAREALGGAGQGGAAAAEALLTHNVGGAVLAHCDLAELKQVLSLPFGDWELFKMLVISLRDIELTQPIVPPITVIAEATPEDADEPPAKPQRPALETQRSRPSNVEKQVTLEEQMICGALQTLSEEALEDVLTSDAPAPDGEATSLVLVGGSPPASPAPRRADPSILRAGGSLRGRRAPDTNVTFKFEDETRHDEHITFNIDRDGPAAQYCRERDAGVAGEASLDAHAAHSSHYGQNSKHDNLLRQGSARPESLYASEEADSLEFSAKLNHIRTEILVNVNSSEKLSRLKGRFLRGGGDSAAHSDDESTPLVSPPSSHRFVESPCGGAADRRGSTDATLSTDYSPASSAPASPDADVGPARKGAAPREPRGPALMRGADRWRQDAVDGWDEPESAV